MMNVKFLVKFRTVSGVIHMIQYKSCQIALYAGTPSEDDEAEAGSRAPFAMKVLCRNLTFQNCVRLTLKYLALGPTPIKPEHVSPSLKLQFCSSAAHAVGVCAVQ